MVPAMPKSPVMEIPRLMVHCAVDASVILFAIRFQQVEPPMLTRGPAACRRTLLTVRRPVQPHIAPSCGQRLLHARPASVITLTANRPRARPGSARAFAASFMPFAITRSLRSHVAGEHDKSSFRSAHSSNCSMANATAR